MKVPLYWLKEYVTLPKNTREMTDKLTMVGHMLDKTSYYDNKEVADLELRGNRADCYSIYGVAREVAAIYGSKIKQPEIISLKKGAIKTKLKVMSDYVKRVGMVEIKDVTITKSPKWLSDALKAYGLESINNIVDLTNYVMIELGEPMHAFDADKIGDSLQIRLAKDKEKMTTFQGSEVTLTKEDLVWAKGDTVLSVAGAIGEKYNSISDTTKNILVEAANYDRANIRRSVYRHKLFTEAGIRHEKDLDPNMVDVALARFLYLVKKHGWGTFNPVYYDYYPKKVNSWNVKVDLKQINQLGGIDIDLKTVLKILRGLNFEILSSGKETVTAGVPTYRTDVTLPEDLVEEVLRIYGYDLIPAKTLSLEIPDNITPDFLTQEIALRNSCVSIGLDEVITLSFVDEANQSLNLHPFQTGYRPPALLNPPSPDTKYMRQSLLPNLYVTAQKIINERGNFLQLFEIGKVYTENKGKYSESRKLGIIYWTKEKSEFRNFKGLLEAFFLKSNLPMPNPVSLPKNIPLLNSFDLMLDKKTIGYGGMIGEMFFAEIDLDSILGKDKKYTVSLWPKYPPQIEDLTFELPEKTFIGDVIDEIKSVKLVKTADLKDVYKNSYTFRVWYQDPQKTLTDKEVKNIRNNIITNLQKIFSAQIKD